MRYIIYFFILFLITTSAYSKENNNITYEVNNIKYEGYYLHANKRAPFVLLIHDWDGLTKYEVKRAHMLNKLGYTVFAIDLFGAGVRPTRIKDKRQHTGELYKDRKKMRNIMNAAIKKAKSKGANIKNAVAIGYCFGGAAVLELARSGANLKGFVTFHGGLATPKGQNYSKTKGKILVLHGTADKAITMDDFSNLAKELEAAKIPHEMITYGGADHAFTVIGGGRYNKSADKKSWSRFLDFLRKVVKK